MGNCFVCNKRKVRGFVVSSRSNSLSLECVYLCLPFDVCPDRCENPFHVDRGHNPSALEIAWEESVEATINLGAVALEQEQSWITQRVWERTFSTISPFKYHIDGAPTSHAAAIKSRAAMLKMHAFLKANLRPWHVLQEYLPENSLPKSHPNYDTTTRPLKGGGFIHDSRLLRIGFELNPTQPFEMAYAMTVVRWVASKIGKRTYLTFLSEIIPITEPEDTNELGCSKVERPWLPPFSDSKLYAHTLVISEWTPEQIPTILMVFGLLHCYMSGKREEILARIQSELQNPSPLIFRNEDYFVLETLNNRLQYHGIASHLEYGPYQIPEWDREIAERDESIYQAVDRIILDQMIMLDAKWERDNV